MQKPPFAHYAGGVTLVETSESPLMSEAPVPDPIPNRVVFNGTTPLGLALVAAAVFGSIAFFCFYIVVVAVSLGEAGSWFFLVLLALSVLLFWAVIVVLWGALGVWMIVTPKGARTFGAFGVRRYPMPGVRAGYFETISSRAPHGNTAQRRSRKVRQLWLRAPGRKPCMVFQADTNDPVHSRIIQAFDHAMGMPITTLERADGSLTVRPDFTVFD